MRKYNTVMSSAVDYQCFICANNSIKVVIKLNENTVKINKHYLGINVDIKVQA